MILIIHFKTIKSKKIICYECSPPSVHKDGFWYERKDYENRLAKLPGLCWQFHRVELRQGKDYFEAFKNLLKILIQRQNNLAM